MQATHLDLLGDLGDQIPAAELSFGIRQPVDYHSRRLERKAAVIDPPEFEYVSPAELMEVLLEFTTVSPHVESWLRDELGAARFSRLAKLLFQVWQTDRMI